MPGPDRRRLLGVLGSSLVAVPGLAFAAREERLPVRRLLAEEWSALEQAPAAGFWTGSPGAADRLATLLAALAGAAREGLDPADYAVADLRVQAAQLGPAAERAAWAALLAYAREVRRGRDLPGLPPRPPTALERPAAILEAARTAPDLGAFLEGLPPPTPRYARLRLALSELRSLAAAGGWTPVPDLPRLEPGGRHPGVPALRRRLRESADLVGPADGETIDPALAAAIRAFQARHGLEADGIVGRRTLAALRVPAQARIRQLILNLERRRRVPLDLGPRHVLVNIADFALKLVLRVEGPQRERTLLTRPVIVGTAYHQTPAFAARITDVVLNPYWHVPRSIAVDEFLPLIRKDPGWLARERMVVLDAAGRPVDPAAVPWASLGRRNFPYRLRQEPGAENALGRLKLELPNPHAVYLHDTPKKALFGRSVRTFSHGCVRVEDVLGLAEMLLAPQGWDRARLEWAIEAGGRRSIRLAEPVPVYLAYFTAWVNADGTVHFRDDVYGRDARLARDLRIN